MKSPLNVRTWTLASVLACGLMATTATGDELTKDAAIGGAVGGALGGAIGAELGGREGAIVGAGIGAATGAAITTQEEAHKMLREPPKELLVVVRPEPPRFCPPGHAKQGRC